MLGVHAMSEGSYTRVKNGKLKDLGQGAAQIVGTESIQPTKTHYGYVFNTSYEFLGKDQVSPHEFCLQVHGCLATSPCSPAA